MAVSQVEGRAALPLRSRPLALIDIIGARRGRTGCSRGWRAAGPVREPGSGAEKEEEKEEEKGSREGGREGQSERAPSQRRAKQILHRLLAPTERRQLQCLEIPS